MVEWEKVLTAIQGEDVNWKTLFRRLAEDICDHQYTHPWDTQDIIDFILKDKVQEERIDEMLSVLEARRY
jgi:hypothetical protein